MENGTKVSISCESVQISLRVGDEGKGFDGLLSLLDFIDFNRSSIGTLMSIKNILRVYANYKRNVTEMEKKMIGKIQNVSTF